MLCNFRNYSRGAPLESLQVGFRAVDDARAGRFANLPPVVEYIYYHALDVPVRVDFAQAPHVSSRLIAAIDIVEGLPYRPAGGFAVPHVDFVGGSVAHHQVRANGKAVDLVFGFHLQDIVAHEVVLMPSTKPRL